MPSEFNSEALKFLPRASNDWQNLSKPNHDPSEFLKRPLEFGLDAFSLGLDGFQLNLETLRRNLKTLEPNF